MLGVPPLVAQDGRTPLYVAAEKGHLEIVRHLLDQSANVDAATKVSEGWLRAWGRQEGQVQAVGGREVGVGSEVKGGNEE